MCTYYLYLVRCNNNALYCGITTHIERRVEEHNTSSLKSAKYTWAHRPVLLVWAEAYQTKSQALKREREVKQLSKKQKEALIKQEVAIHISRKERAHMKTSGNYHKK